MTHSANGMALDPLIPTVTLDCVFMLSHKQYNDFRAPLFLNANGRFNTAHNSYPQRGLMICSIRNFQTNQGPAAAGA